MRFCGMNVYFDTWQASADSYLCQGLPSDILSIYIIIYFNGQYWLYTWYFILYVILKEIRWVF